MIAQALRLGANAIIGVRYVSSAMSHTNAVETQAFGTAVIIQHTPQPAVIDRSAAAAAVAAAEAMAASQQSTH